MTKNTSIFDNSEMKLLKAKGEYIQRKLYSSDTGFFSTRNTAPFELDDDRCEQFLWTHKQTLRSIYRRECSKDIAVLVYMLTHLNITPNSLLLLLTAKL